MSTQGKREEWVVSESSDGRTGIHVREAAIRYEGATAGVSVCQVNKSAGLTVARERARLIAAAPKMLEVLQELEAAYDMHERPSDEVIETVRAVLAEVEGK